MEKRCNVAKNLPTTAMPFDHNSKPASVIMTEIAEKVALFPVLRPIIRGFGFIFVDLAPDLPQAELYALSQRKRREIFVAAYLITVLFCLVIPAVWTALNGTFRGDDARILYFSQDIHNIILYAFICPAYIGFGVLLIITAYAGGHNLCSVENETSCATLSRRSMLFQIPLLCVVILGVALTLTSMYIRDVSDIDRIEYVYWFLEETPQGGSRLGALGVYYFLLNFVLLLVTLVSLTCFMSVFAATMRIANNVKMLERPLADNAVEAFSLRFEIFVRVYYLAKFLIAAYILNFWIWHKSPLGKVENLHIAHFFLMLVVFVFMTIPIFYLELQWYRHRMRYAIKVSESLLNIEGIAARMNMGYAVVVSKTLDFLLLGSVFYVPGLSEFLSY